jgi:autotransporter-associated beta strand protein
MKARFCFVFAAALPLAFATYTQAQTFNNATADGLAWGVAGNWTPATVPNAIDAEAILDGAGPSGTAPASLALDVLLDGNYTIGKFTRSVTGGQPATFPTTPVGGDATKGLTLQKSSGQPEINVVGDVFFYSAIFGTQGFEKTGAGRFTLRFNGMNQTYSGPVKISGGTLGIEKDRSLGDVGNSIEIANGARLFAEPGSNAGTITLPATRSIILGGAFPQIGSANANVHLIIEANISDGGNGFGIDKTDGGAVTLAGTNSWTGASGVSGGFLSAAQPAALPGYGTQIYSVNGTSTLAVRHGDGTPSWSAAEIAVLLGNGNLSFETNASFGIDTTGNAADTVFEGDLANDFAIPRFTKMGPGKLTLSKAPDLSRLTVFEGTLALDVTSQPAAAVAMLFSKTGGTLDLGTLTVDGLSLAHVNGGTTTIANGTLTLPATVSFNAAAANTVLSLPGANLTIGRVQPFGGNTTTINGAGGSLTVNGDFNFDVNGNHNTRLNLSGLSSFTYDRPLRAFRSIPVTAATDVTNELLLAADGLGTNLIKAAAVSIGGATGSSQGNAHQGQLRLGASNEFRTPAFTLGGFNGSGVVTFQAGLTSPTFKLRGPDGTSAIPLLKVGESSSGVRSGAGTLDLTGGTADILATGIVMGRHISGSNNGYTNEFILPDGTVTATNLILTEKVNSGTPTHISNLIQQGGSVTVDSITMAQVGYGAALAGQNLRGNYTLDGGTLTAGNINGFSQVETATGVGIITTAGSLDVTVTSADLPGPPVTVSVPVLTADNTADKWIVKVANALNADAVISSEFIAATSGANVFLTRRAGGSVDTTLNIALANGTAAGITEAPTSVETTTSAQKSNIQRNLILRSGTLINQSGSDLAINDVTVVVSGISSTIVDSTAGQKVVLGSGATYSARLNSADQSVGTLTVDGDLDISASPAFVILDDAAGDASLVPGGTELVLIDYQGGALTGTFAGIADGATVSVTKGTVTNEFIIDYNDPDHGGKAVTLTSSNAASGNNFASWANDPAKGNIPGEPATGDFDNDGLTNIVEYALGKDPRVSSQPAGDLSGDKITFTKGLDAIANRDVSWVIETSTTLAAGSWTPVVTQPAGDGTSTISYTFTPGTPVKNFARLSVTQVP